LVFAPNTKSNSSSVLSARFVEQSMDFRRSRYVGANRDRSPATTANGSHDFLCGLLAANVIDDDGGPVLRESFGDRAANAARAARYDCDLTFEW
jgi:hypothetical protein